MAEAQVSDISEVTQLSVIVVMATEERYEIPLETLASSIRCKLILAIYHTFFTFNH